MSVSARLLVDPDYSNRRGFDESFLGLAVRLPQVVGGSRRLDPGGGGAGAGASPLDYEHFSVVMSQERKLARFVAVNIDGARTVDVGPREDDKWIFDELIPEDAQMGDWLYDDNDFDRGHLVRRLDPVWGDTPEEALRAEADTFHFTNCAPQHWRFNRLRDFWQGIEIYILDNVELHDLRVSLFTGPVLASDDPPLEGTQVPRDYWKVVAMRKRDGTLAAAAYLLSQGELLRAPPEEFVFGEYKTFQVGVSELEERAGLNFGDLRDHDSFARLRAVDAGVPPRIALERHAQMVL
jgi:endonuclease G, mitochondrial